MRAGPNSAWRTALQASASRIVRVDCFGDSFTADGGGSSDGVLSYPGVLRESLGSLSAGIGWSNSPVMVGENAITWSWMGPWQRIINRGDASGGSFTYNIAEGIKARLGLAPCAYHDVLVYVTVDGGAAQSIPVPWTLFHPVITNIDLGELGSHTLVITVKDNDMVWVNGIEVTTKETGILINNYGFGGWSSVFWHDALPESGAWLPQEAPDLAIFWDGLNDWSQQVALNTFSDNLLGVVDRLTKACPSVVMISIPAAFDGHMATRGAYNAVIESVVSLTGVDFLDMDLVWSSDRATNEVLGYIVPANSDHPSQSGENVIAAAIRESYFRPAGVPGQLTQPEVAATIQRMATLSLNAQAKLQSAIDLLVKGSAYEMPFAADVIARVAPAVEASGFMTAGRFYEEAKNHPISVLLRWAQYLGS